MTDRMHDRLQTLSDREKATLHLLLDGHDAKSIARTLDLSVHTVNERLREARRKLGVSSSREAARLLAAAERGDPQFIGDKQIGVGSATAIGAGAPPSERRRDAGLRLIWIGGGMIVMSLIIAAAALLPALYGSGQPAVASSASVASPAIATLASVRAALAWAELLDRQRWDVAWNAAGAALKAQVPAPTFAAATRSARQPLGAVSARVLQSTTMATSLPGLPAGDYAVLQFGTTFAHRQGAVETITLVRERGGWTVIGYFIR